ncbi:MAG TPA: hypothetical protein VNN74_03725 [Candidatus Micrarchaeia archaeon]|nr:hypothetical protein [Candidatus Micrarchaeia archaeon]
MTGRTERCPVAGASRRGRGRVQALAAASTVAVLAMAAMPAAAHTARLTAARAERLADSPQRLGALGPMMLRTVSVRSVRAWGPPYPTGQGPEALVWHVTFDGWFRLLPCVERPLPMAAKPALMCAAATAGGPARAPRLIACPILPRWPLPPPLCLGSWHRQVTISIADSGGVWLGAAYGPALGMKGWRRPPLVVPRPRSGETIVLTVGQALLLGPPPAPTGTRVGPYTSSDDPVLAPIPPVTAASLGTSAFIAGRPGSASVAATWQPVCPAGTACPPYLVRITLQVRVMVPVDPPPAA